MPAGCSRRLHEKSRQSRINHHGHKKTRRQGHDEGDRQIFHEFSHDSRPENHGQKGHQRGDGRSDHRPGDFSRGPHGRLDSGHPLLHIPVDILNNDDGVINEHAQGQGQGKEHHHIQRNAQHVKHDKRQQHGKRDRHGHQQGVERPQGKQQDPGNEDQAGDNIVFQVRDHAPDLLGLVHQLGDIGTRGPGRLPGGD